MEQRTISIKARQFLAYCTGPKTSSSFPVATSESTLNRNQSLYGVLGETYLDRHKHEFDNIDSGIIVLLPVNLNGSSCDLLILSSTHIHIFPSLMMRLYTQCSFIIVDHNDDHLCEILIFFKSFVF